MPLMSYRLLFSWIVIGLSLSCLAAASDPAGGNFVTSSEEHIKKIDDLHRKAEGLIVENKFREAVDVYWRIVLIEPDDETAYTNMGNAYMILGDTGRARESFLNALDINPENETAALGLQKILDPYSH